MGSAKQNELGPHLPERSRLRHSQWAAGSLLFGLFVLSLACGHDAERENPLDPTLTPPVELQAELHDSTGAVHLSWSTYDGIQPLAAYLVLRNVARSTTLDTLVSITHVDSTRFIDATLAPDTAYEYRVAAINDGGLAQPSAIHRIDGFRTTAVQLTARADAATGAIHLAWSQYLDPGFEGYTLLRRAAGTDVDEALYQNDEASDTTYVDSTVLHGVEYGYRVVSSAAGQQQSSTAQLAGVQLSAPELISIDLDSRTAQATLAWTSYGGPRFSHYEVVRLVEGEVPAVVAMLDAITDTTLVDSGLHGNTFYRYKVVVATTAGERPESGELHGTFHEQVATWPLDIPEDAAVRLEFRDGELEALVASKDSVALRSLSRDGVLQERQLLYSNGFLFDIERPILPAATAMAARPDGSRHLVIAQQDRVMLQAHDALGAPAWRLLLEEQQTTEDPGSGGFRIVGSPAFFEEIRIGGRFTYIDRIVGRVAGETVLVEDFFNSDVGPLQVSTITFSTLEQTYPLFDNGLAVLIMNLVGNKAPGFSGDLQSTSSPGIEVQAALGASARLLLVMDVPTVVAVDMFR